MSKSVFPVKVNTWPCCPTSGGGSIFTALHNDPRLGLDSPEFGIPHWLRQGTDAADFQGGLLLDRHTFLGPALCVGSAGPKQQYRHQYRRERGFSDFTGQVQFQSAQRPARHKTRLEDDTGFF